MRVPSDTQAGAGPADWRALPAGEGQSQLRSSSLRSEAVGLGVLGNSGATTHTQDVSLKRRAGSPERPAFAARDGASKTPGSGTSCVWGGAAKYQPARNRKPRSMQRPVNWRETRGQETKNRALGPVSEDGGEDGDRTHDLIDANDALSQLSYPPTEGPRIIRSHRARG